MRHAPSKNVALYINTYRAGLRDMRTLISA